MTEQERDRQPIATVSLYRLESVPPTPARKGDSDFDSDDSLGGTRLIMTAEEADISRTAALKEQEEKRELAETKVGSCNLYLSGGVTIGRRSKCDLRTIHRNKTFDSTVSGVHCIISVSHDSGTPQVQVTDNSSNSTFINETTRIRKSETRPFSEDTFLALGRNIDRPDYNGPPRRFRVRYELTPFGIEEKVNNTP